MKSKRLATWIVILIVLMITQGANGQYIPLTAKEAVERADPEAKQWAADAQLILVGTVDGSGTYPGMYPDGKGDAWNCAYYSAAKDSAYSYYATKDGPIGREWQPKEGFNSLTPIGTNWQDSNVVGRKAERNGGSSFRAKHPDTIVGAALNYDTIYEHTDHPRWGFWWTLAYWSAADNIFISFEFAAGSGAPAPKWTITKSNPQQGQDVVFTGSVNDTLAVLNFSSGILDSVKIDKIDGYFPDTTNTDNVIKQYYNITSYPENAPFEGTLTLFYDQWRFDDSGISDEAGLQLYRHNGERWELVGGTADPERNSVTKTGITTFSKWTFGNPNDQPLKVDEMLSQHPEDFVLWQNYPNPFNPETVIKYHLSQKGYVELTIFNLLGQRVKTLVNAVKTAGTFETRWDGTDDRDRLVPSNVYFYQMNSRKLVRTKKMILLK